MAITWRDKDGNVTVTHQGRVCATTSEVRRVMSDVWSDEYYAVVLTDAGGTENVHIGSAFDLYDGPWGAVDLDPEAVATYKVILERRKAAELAAYRAKLAADALARAQRVWDAPERGKRMKVVGGRKVPKGTEGTVVWVGPDQFNAGLRVGLKDDNGTVHWTSAKNVANVLPYIKAA